LTCACLHPAANENDCQNRFDDYAASGQQYINIFADWALPGITRASMSVFEDAPAGGTAYGSIANTLTDVEPIITIPPLG
jgi:hypothetical protein